MFEAPSTEGISEVNIEINEAEKMLQRLKLNVA
jgi:hypothetical protein